MAKISIRLDTRRQKIDGTYPLKVAVHRKGKTLLIPLNVSVRADEWDKAKQEVVKHSDRLTLNAVLRERLASVNARFFKLQLAGELRNMSNKRLVSLLTNADETPTIPLFADYFNSFILTIANKRTKELYEATLKSLQNFTTQYNVLTFDDITPSWLRSFEAYLSKRGNRINSRSIHLRNIRAVFNAALSDEIITCYPFRRFKIKSQQTAKRALTKEQLLALMSADVEEHQRKYVDMFFLGLFLMGINVVDMAALNEIREGRIEYERAKTHKLYSVKVEPEALDIIKRYPGKHSLLSFFDNVKSYRSVANRQNYNLQKIGEKIGLKDITYYWCRHTWATLAAELDIPDEVIAMALGHSRGTVTDIYIKRNRDKIDQANRKVIDYIFSVNN